MKNRMIDVMPSGMQIPKEIKALYQYIEDNHLYIDKNGCRYGVLFPEDELMASRTEHGREGGTRIIFYPGGTENLKYWFAVGKMRNCSKGYVSLHRPVGRAPRRRSGLRMKGN